MQEVREERVTPGRLLRADQVRQMLGVDRSTIYRMAENGRLPAMVAFRQEWKRLAQDPDFRPRFRPGPLAFDRARAFVRAGPRLVAMLVADGVAATDDPRALYRLSTQERARVLAALPVIAARTSRLAAEYPSDLNDRSKA